MVNDHWTSLKRTITKRANLHTTHLVRFFLGSLIPRVLSHNAHNYVHASHTEMALAKRGILTLYYPIKHVWFECLLRNCFVVCSHSPSRTAASCTQHTLTHTYTRSTYHSIPTAICCRLTFTRTLAAPECAHTPHTLHTHSPNRSLQGLIDNWDHVEKMMHETFYNELRVAPEE